MSLKDYDDKPRKIKTRVINFYYYVCQEKKPPPPDLLESINMSPAFTLFSHLYTPSPPSLPPTRKITKDKVSIKSKQMSRWGGGE
jgi:hypothetical protein